MEFIQATITLLSLLAAVLAWIAKIKWSNQFIKAKDEQIKTLNTLNMSLKESKDEEIKKLEDLNSNLNSELEQGKSKTIELEKHVEDLNSSKENITSEVGDLKSQIEALNKEIDELIENDVKIKCIPRKCLVAVDGN